MANKDKELFKRIANLLTKEEVTLDLSQIVSYMQGLISARKALIPAGELIDSIPGKHIASSALGISCGLYSTLIISMGHALRKDPLWVDEMLINKLIKLPNIDLLLPPTYLRKETDKYVMVCLTNEVPNQKLATLINDIMVGNKIITEENFNMVNEQIMDIWLNE